MNEEKKKQLEQTIARINKQFGSGTVQTAQEAYESGKLVKKRIATPSLEVNDMLHGGFAGIVELYGPTGSGKTSLAIETIAKAQRENPDFVAGWLETEDSVEREILAMHGIDLNRLMYWRQEDSGGTAENALDVSRAFIQSGLVDLLVVNSVAGLAPQTEVENDMDKANVALTARLMSKYFRVITGPAGKHDICLLFINQERDNVGTMYGNPTTTTGGKALGFYASQRIRMNKVKLQKEDPITEQDGIKISCRVSKNRFAGTGNPYTKCHYYAMYASGIDSIIPLPDILNNHGIVKKAGAWWSYDNNGELLKWKSRAVFVEELKKNDVLRNMLLSQLNGLSEDMNEAEVTEIESEQNALAEEMEALENV